jgi:hypothetical protein
MKRYLAALAAAAFGLGLLLCLPPADAQNAPSGWGTIKGQVVYGGDSIPEPMKLKVDKDKEHCLAKGDLFSEKWVVNKTNKGVRNVFVWLIQGDPASEEPLPIHPKLKAAPDKEVEIDQPRCQFIPHAVTLREGQTLLAKNSSTITHNFNIQGHPLVNKGQNVLMPPGSKAPVPGLKAQKLPLHVTCNIHGWMDAWVGVYNHPYHAVTDKDGNFEIKLAPAGQYRIMVWQEAIGYMGGAKGRNGTPITIKANDTTDLGKLKVQAK